MIGETGAQAISRPEFLLGVGRREDPADRRRHDAIARQRLGYAVEFRRIGRRDRTTIELEAAVNHIGVAADCLAQIRRPVGQGRHARGRREADANRRRRHQIAALDHSVREMGGADHDRVDRAARRRARLQDCPECRYDPTRHIGGRWALGGR